MDQLGCRGGGVGGVGIGGSLVSLLELDSASIPPLALNCMNKELIMIRRFCILAWPRCLKGDGQGM
jgi:hypothetical protein